MKQSKNQIKQAIDRSLRGATILEDSATYRQPSVGQSFQPATWHPSRLLHHQCRQWNSNTVLGIPASLGIAAKSGGNFMMWLDVPWQCPIWILVSETRKSHSKMARQQNPFQNDCFLYLSANAKRANCVSRNSCSRSRMDRNHQSPHTRRCGHILPQRRYHRGHSHRNPRCFGRSHRNPKCFGRIHRDTTRCYRQRGLPLASLSTRALRQFLEQWWIPNLDLGHCQTKKQIGHVPCKAIYALIF
jgi:hypothetical protein